MSIEFPENQKEDEEQFIKWLEQVRQKMEFGSPLVQNVDEIKDIKYG